VNEDAVRALADAVALPLRPDRAAEVAELLETLTREGGGVTSDEVARVEPAAAFDPAWPS
jgi:hypothetical protein